MPSRPPAKHTGAAGTIARRARDVIEVQKGRKQATPSDHSFMRIVSAVVGGAPTLSVRA